MKLHRFLNTVKIFFSFCKRLTSSYFQKERFSAVAIPGLSIGVTNVCASRCVYCINRYLNIKPQHMDMDLFKKAVNQFVDMGGVDVNFCVLIGEPLLDPFLIERARYLKQFPQLKFAGFFTTLQWLHKFNINDFFELGPISITISTALSGKDKYREFFGTNNYDQTLKNIVFLIKENKKRQNIMDIKFSIMFTNEPMKSVIGHPDFQLINNLTSGKMIQAINRRGLCLDDWSGLVKLPKYLKKRKRPVLLRLFRPCRFFYNNLYVFPNGDVGICPCRDFGKELVLGNIVDDCLGELWHGKKINLFRNNWRKKNIIPRVCKKCNQYVY